MTQNHTASTAFQEFTKWAKKLGGVGGQVIGLETYQLRYTGEAESEVANAILATEAQNAQLLEALEAATERLEITGQQCYWFRDILRQLKECEVGECTECGTETTVQRAYVGGTNPSHDCSDVAWLCKDCLGETK